MTTSEASVARPSNDIESIAYRYRSDFPILAQRSSSGQPLIYLDHAATSQKPTAVLEALQRYYSNEWGTK